MSEAETIARGVSSLEAELLTGSATGWGSWMFGVASDLTAKGLMRRDRGSYHTTELGTQVAALLTEPAPEPAPGGGS